MSPSFKHRIDKHEEENAMQTKVAPSQGSRKNAEIRNLRVTRLEEQDLSGHAQDERETSRQSMQALAHHIKPGIDLYMLIGEGSCSESVLLPARAATLLLESLKYMSKGLDVVLTPLQPELTTGQAAEILNVSRPHLVKLLDNGEIPHHWVGRHRRVRRDDVMAYRDVLHRQRDAFLDRLVAESQELGMYD